MAEFRQQLQLTRQRRDDADGCIYSYIGPFVENRQGIRDVFREEFYAKPALTPPVVDQSAVVVDPPSLTATSQGVEVSHPDARWLVYTEDGATWELDRIVSSLEPMIDLDSGRWAISATGRHGVESLGVIIEVP